MYISNYKMYTMALRGKTSRYKILYQPTFLLSQLLYYFYQLWFLLPHDFVFTSITIKFSFLTSKHFSFELQLFLRFQQYFSDHLLLYHLIPTYFLKTNKIITIPTKFHHNWKTSQSTDNSNDQDHAPIFIDMYS